MEKAVDRKGDPSTPLTRVYTLASEEELIYTNKYSSLHTIHVESKTISELSTQAQLVLDG